MKGLWKVYRFKSYSILLLKIRRSDGIVLISKRRIDIQGGNNEKKKFNRKCFEKCFEMMGQHFLFVPEFFFFFFKRSYII